MPYPQSICVLSSSLNDHYTSKQETDIKPNENFDFGFALLSIYDVVEEILEYLPYCDLRSLSQINKNWFTRIDDYLKKRISPHIFYYLDYSQEPSPLCSTTGDNQSIKPNFTLVFFNDHMVKMNYFVCMHRNFISKISSIFKKPGNIIFLI